MTNDECKVLHSLESALIMLTRDIKTIKQTEKLPINLDFHIDCIRADLKIAYISYSYIK